MTRPMTFRANDFLEMTLPRELVGSALEPAFESLHLFIASKYANAVVSGPVVMAATEDAREFLRANYPNLRFQLQPDMTQLRAGEIRFVIDIQGVQFDEGAC